MRNRKQKLTPASPVKSDHAFLLLAAWISLLLGVPLGAKAAKTAEQDPAEAFKQFIASPPNIERLTYRKTIAGDLTKGLARSIGLRGTNDTATFGFARWQPGCLYLKLGRTLSVCEPGKGFGEEVHARFGSELWSLGATGLATLWNDPVVELDRVQEQPSRVFQHRSADLNQVLNMGLMHLGIGTVKWQGDAFNAPGFIPEAGERVTAKGKLITDPAGNAKQLVVDYIIQTNNFHYILRYSYTTNLEVSFLPDVIESFLVSDGHETKLMELTLLEIKTTSAALPRSSFDPAELIKANRMPVVSYKDGSPGMMNSLGRWAPIRERGAAESATFHPERWARNIPYYFAVLLITGAAFLTVRNLNQKHQKKNGVLT